MALEAPDFGAGGGNFNLQDFISYKNLKHQHDIQEMKDIAEFQQNLKLQGLDKQMQMANNNKLNSEAYDRTNPINLGTAPMQLENKGFNNPLAQSKIAQGQEGLDIKKAAEADKTRLGQEGLALKTTAEGKKEDDATKFGQKKDLQGEGENARSTLQTNLQGMKDATSTANTNTRTSTSRANVTTRGQQLLDQIKAKGEQARQTKGTPNPNSATNLATQETTRQMNIATQIRNQNPDLAPFIHIDPNNKTVSVDPTSTGIFGGQSGPTQEQRKRITDQLYPGGTPTVQMGAPTTQPQIPPTGPSAFSPTAPQLQGVPPTAPAPTHIKVQDSKGNPFLWDTTKGDIPDGFTPRVGGGGDEDQGGTQGGSQDDEEGEVGY